MTKTDKKSLKRRAVKHKETRADDCRFPKGSYKPASLLVFCTKGLPSLQYERPSLELLSFRSLPCCSMMLGKQSPCLRY